MSSSTDQTQFPPRNRRRRTRTIYTPEQLSRMEAVFSSNQYPDINSREALADAIDLTEARVQVRHVSIIGPVQHWSSCLGPICYSLYHDILSKCKRVKISLPNRVKLL